jgi:hypothetical protein
VSTPTLRFADVEAIQDLGTYVARARHLDADGAVRLVASGPVLAAWVRVLPGQGLLGQGLVLGLRVMPLDGDHDLDTTVPLGGVADRLARRAAEGRVDTELPVPPTTVAAPWTALTPPRTGWQVVAEVDPDLLVETARQGIAAVAQGTPGGAGAQAVAALRARIWGVDLPGTPPGTPAGTAFAAYSLGFVRPGEPAVVRRQGPWTRLSTTAGHVLAR